MRRRREREWEDLLKLSTIWLVAIGIWIWARLTPPPTMPKFGSTSDVVGVVVVTFLIGMRPLVDAVMPFVVLGTPVLFGVWFFFVRRARKEMRRDQTALTLRQLSPDRFEDWCAVGLRGLGYEVKVVGAVGDHGIDLIATKDGEEAVVQCKRFAEGVAVTEPLLRDLYGAMHAMGASNAIMVTTGHYTSPAREWARGKPIALWGPEQLAAAAGPINSAVPAASAELASERCPRCGSDLVARTNRRTRDRFIGCSMYPRCRFTRPA